jgi:hypothetical protein
LPPPREPKVVAATPVVVEEATPEATPEVVKVDTEQNTEVNVAATPRVVRRAKS